MADETLRLTGDVDVQRIAAEDCRYAAESMILVPSERTRRFIVAFRALARALEMEGMTVAGVLKSCENAEYFLAYNGDPDFKEDHLRRVRVLRALRDGSEG